MSGLNIIEVCVTSTCGLSQQPQGFVIGLAERNAHSIYLLLIPLLNLTTKFCQYSTAMALSDGKEDNFLCPDADVWDNLFEAAEKGNEPRFNELLEQWKCHNLDQEIIDACLYAAVSGHRPDFMRKLMSHGADPEGAVSRALEVNASTDVWQAFLDYGWDVNSRDTGGNPIVLLVSPYLTSWVLVLYFSHRRDMDTTINYPILP